MHGRNEAIFKLGVLLLMSCVIAANGAMAVTLDDIFQVQAGEAPLLDESSYNLVIEGEHFGERGRQSTRRVYSIDRTAGSVFCQFERIDSGVHIEMDDGTTPPPDVVQARQQTPSVTAGRVLALEDYAIVWADLTRPQLQIYYKDDWQQFGAVEELDAHLSIFVPGAPSSISFGGGVNEGTLEAYYQGLKARLAGRPAGDSLNWNVVEKDATIRVEGHINGHPYMRVTLDAGLGFRVTKAEAGFSDSGIALESWTKTYQNIDGAWFPHVLTQVRRRDSGEIVQRATWTFSNVSVVNTGSVSDDAWRERMQFPPRALVMRVSPPGANVAAEDFELIGNELREVQDLNDLVYSLNLAR